MYPLRYHAIGVDNWYSKPKKFQLLNIATELTRANHWIVSNRADLVNDCYDRALELIDLTRSDPRWQAGLRELSRGREFLAGLRWAPVKNGPANDRLRRCLLVLNAEAYRQIKSQGKKDAH